MKASEVYLKAAEIVYRRGQFPSCNAINFVVNGDYQRVSYEAERYSKLFAPTENYSGFWLHRAASIEEDEMDDWRILALLFAHAICLDEERSRHDHAE